MSIVQVKEYIHICMIYAAGLRNVSENFGTEILNHLKPVRNMRRKVSRWILYIWN